MRLPGRVHRELLLVSLASGADRAPNAEGTTAETHEKPLCSQTPGCARGFAKIA
jgi:hypothetical protein